MWQPALHFLDLTDANEEERSLIHTALFTQNPDLNYPELPWMAHPDMMCSPAEWRPAPYAVAPIPHPTLRGVFLPPPMYAPAPPALGLVPTVAAAGEPTDGSSVAVSLDGDDCNSSATQDASSPIGQETVSQEPHSAGTGVHTSSSVYAETQVMTGPPQIPTSVPTQPPVMTTMYHLPHISPLSNVYVSNVTANVNVHGYPYSAYQHIPPQQVYTGEVSHESAPTTNRNGRDSRRIRGKQNTKRMDGQFSDRNTAGRHSQDVIPTQPSPLVDSPPTVNSNMPPQSYSMYPISPMHHAYPAQFFNTGTPSHPTHHLPHHPNPQHGTPIYISSHPSMYPPTLYGTYAPHQPGAPPIMAFPAAMQSGPVPTTENSLEGGGTEEPASVSNKEAELNELNVHQSQKQPVVYSSESVQEICEVVVIEQNKAKPTGYQQQQSEEDDYNQAHLVNTVVVSNSNIVSESLSFTEVKQSGVSEPKNRNLTPASGHQNLSKDAIPPNFVPEKKASNSEVIVDSSVLSNQPSRANIGEMNASVNTVVNDVCSMREKTIVSAVTQHDKSHVDIKSSVSCVDVPTTVVPTPKPAMGSSTENVALFTVNSGGVQHQTSGQNVTTVATASQSVEMPASQVSTPTASTSKSWASLFKNPNSPGEPGMIITGTSVSGTSSGIKPLACVKPFQNAVPVSSDTSRRVSEGHAVPLSSASSVVSSVSGGKSFPNASSTSAEDPYLYRLGEFLSKYQLEHKTLSLQPRGLTNRSNWCYINSILQALLACPPFYNLMRDLQKQLTARRTAKSTTPIIDSMVQFVGEFVPLSAASRPRDRKEKAVRKDDGSIEDQCGAPFEPNYIYKMLNNIRSDTFKVEGRQEDAEEFLGCLLNALNDEMLELIKLVEEPTTKSTLSNGDIATNGDTSVQSQDEDDTEWKVMGPKNKGSITRRADFGRTPISDIFRGQLRSRVQRAGDHSTDNVQPFFTLQLDIEKAQSVKEALEILVGRDQLEGVTCSRTNQEVEAWQQVTLEELPLVLLLHLKWFDYKIDGASKIVKCVEFPIDLKVDQKLMSSSKKYGPKQRQYKLFAVVYHDGKEATKGHYVTDVYHVGYGGWVRYDDSVVKAVQEINVLNPKCPRVPYLLYYRRCDTIGSTQPSSVPDKVR